MAFTVDKDTGIAFKGVAAKEHLRDVRVLLDDGEFVALFSDEALAEGFRRAYMVSGKVVTPVVDPICVGGEVLTENKAFEVVLFRNGSSNIKRMTDYDGIVRAIQREKEGGRHENRWSLCLFAVDAVQALHVAIGELKSVMGGDDSEEDDDD